VDIDDADRGLMMLSSNRPSGSISCGGGGNRSEDRRDDEDTDGAR
jgi:hypothetical protein